MPATTWSRTPEAAPPSSAPAACLETFPMGRSRMAVGGGGGISSDFVPPDQYIVGPGSVSCAGQITATFTWIESYEGDPSPSVVVVRQTAGADWSGDSGSCANGLGHAASPVPPPTVYHQDSFGTTYVVRPNPGASFSLTLTPTASAVKALNGPSPHQVASANVSWVCAVHTPSLSISGVIDPVSDRRLLIGQRLAAAVALGGLPSDASTSYSWTVAGGSPFADYAPTTPTAVFTPFASPNAGTLACYFAIPATGITLTASVSLPTIGVTFQLSEGKVTTVAPELTHLYEDIGAMQLLPNNQSPTEFVLEGATYPNPPKTHGVFYDAIVHTPAPFTPGETGFWNFTQLFKPELTGTAYPSGAPLTVANVGLWGLDHSFPYVGPVVASSQYILIFSDRPGVPSLTDVASVTIDFQFQLFVMYLAPGASKYVPLSVTPWSCAGTATRGNPWTVSGTAQSVGSTAQFPAHPVWQLVHNP